MKKIKEFLKLRKQNDSVKIMCLFVILGIVMAVLAIVNGVNLYREINAPTEYVLKSDKNISGNTYEQLLKIKNVKAVGKEKTETISFGGSETLECIIVSDKYLEEVFGIKETTGMKTFYISKKIRDKMADNPEAVFGKNSIQTENLKKLTDTTKATLDCKVGDNGKKAAAGFLLIKNKLTDDKEVILCRGSEAELTKDVDELRAYIKGQDISGTLRKKIEKKGYTIDNGEEIKDFEYESNVRFLKIKYDIAISLLCLFFTVYKHMFE